MTCEDIKPLWHEYMRQTLLFWSKFWIPWYRWPAYEKKFLERIR